MQRNSTNSNNVAKKNLKDKVLDQVLKIILLFRPRLYIGAKQRLWLSVCFHSYYIIKILTSASIINFDQLCEVAFFSILFRFINFISLFLSSTPSNVGFKFIDLNHFVSPIKDLLYLRWNDYHLRGCFETLMTLFPI